jgi:hypothetical protein
MRQAKKSEKNSKIDDSFLELNVGNIKKYVELVFSISLKQDRLFVQSEALRLKLLARSNQDFSVEEKKMFGLLSTFLNAFARREIEYHSEQYQLKLDELLRECDKNITVTSSQLSVHGSGDNIQSSKKGGKGFSACGPVGLFSEKPVSRQNNNRVFSGEKKALIDIARRLEDSNRLKFIASAYDVLREKKCFVLFGYKCTLFAGAHFLENVEKFYKTSTGNVLPNNAGDQMKAIEDYIKIKKNSRTAQAHKIWYDAEVENARKGFL